MSLLFYIFAIATCGAAVAVVLSQNVVRMAFWLVISLGSASGLFFLANADFVGATQLLIYVGGTLVLLVFGVMLTASGPYLKISASTSEVAAAAGIGSLVLLVLIATVWSVDWEANNKKLASVQPTTIVGEGYNDVAQGNTSRPLGLSLLGVRADRDLSRKPIAPKGDPTQSDSATTSSKAARLSPGYLLPFEIASVHLLVVLIGAAYLARAKRRVPSAAEEN